MGGGLQGGAQGVARLDKATKGKGDKWFDIKGGKWLDTPLFG